MSSGLAPAVTNDWVIMKLFDSMAGTPAENVARLMAELVISIADNEADMGVPTGTAYDALWDVYMQFEGTALDGIAEDARRTRKRMRDAAEAEGFEFEPEIWNNVTV